MKILVTGADGFIGSHLAEILVKNGYDLHCTIFDKGSANYLDPKLRVKRFTGDIRDLSFVKKAMKGCDKVFNLVGALNVPTSTYDDFFSTNVEGARNIMEASLQLKIKKVVHTSSVVTIKENEKKVDENHLHKTFFMDPYTITKFYGEKIAFEYGAKGLDVTVVNPTIVFGPRDTHTLGNFFKLHLESRIRFVSFLDSRLNIIYVKDAAMGHMLAMEKGKPGNKYILGGDEISLGKFISTLDKVAGVKNPIIKIPKFAVDCASAIFPPLFSIFGKPFPVLRAQAKAMRRGSSVDISKAKKELGFPITPIDEGIKNALEWYIETGYINLR